MTENKAMKGVRSLDSIFDADGKPMKLVVSEPPAGLNLRLSPEFIGKDVQLKCGGPIFTITSLEESPGGWGHTGIVTLHRYDDKDGDLVEGPRVDWRALVMEETA